MAKVNRRIIEVFADWVGLPRPILIGNLYTQFSHGKEIFSFEYSDRWLKEYKGLIMLDPSLQFFSGLQYHTKDHSNFGVFLDSSPDRWGRVLMRRREEQIARMEKRKPRTLLESDYLLGVYDEHRMGGLRFRTDPSGPFLDSNKEFSAPPWTSLRELEFASLQLEKDHSEKNPKYSEWLKMLIAPGGSLGGARPKASVMDEKKHLWIAKFPSGHDDHDIGGWEFLVYKLAKLSQITISEAKAQKFNSRHNTFISKRFDRTSRGRRIHFASAMTLLQREDGDDATKGVSYLELANLIKHQGAQPNHDLEQLWRRIVFNICISNTDDHLRNHGFLLDDKGWILSPAFDINPVPIGQGLKLNISESDNSQDLDLAKSVARYFLVESSRADQIIREVVKPVKGWRKIANSIGITKREQDQLSSAFRVAHGCDL